MAEKKLIPIEWDPEEKVYRRADTREVVKPRPVGKDIADILPCGITGTGVIIKPYELIKVSAQKQGLWDTANAYSEDILSSPHLLNHRIITGHLYII